MWKQAAVVAASTWVGLSGAEAGKTQITVRGAGAIETRACEGGDVSITGTDHQVTLTGECRVVRVSGSHNVIALEAAVRVTLNGSGNQLTYRRGAGKARRPRLAIRGLDNRAIQSAASATTAPSAPGQIAIGDNRQQITRECDRAEVIVSGNDNNVTLLGRCRLLHVSGNGNNVIVEAVPSIVAPGNDNNITWRTGTPKLSNLGSNNRLILTKPQRSRR